MSSLNASHEAVPAPSQSQLALALAIVKLKPAHVDIKDHILKIREHIKHGRDPIRTSFPEKHLDSVAFWQQAYEKSEATQSKLLDRIYELEQRNEALLLKLQPKEPEGTKAQGQGKRKSKANEVITAPLKRAKTQIPTSCGDTARDKFGSYGDVVGGFEPLQGYTAPFMRQLYTLQSTLHKKSSRSSIVLAAASLCKSAEDVLRMVPCEASAPTGRTKTSLQVDNPQPDASSVLNGVQYAYMAIYQALDKLSGGNEKTRETGQVIYHAVSLFESLMELLQRSSKTTVEGSLDKGPSKRQKKVAKPKASKATGKHQASNKEDEDGLATHISSVLCNMMLHLNPSKREHKSLLEGYLFVFLKRIGKVLCVFVFGDLQLRPDLRADTTKLPLPAGLTATCLDDTNLKAMKGEAKYLISILERTIHLLGSLYGSSHSIIASKEGDTANHGQSHGMPLPLQVKKKLQNTLLSAVFGDEPLFKDCLKRPGLPGKAELEKLLAREPVSDKTVPDWFVQEVWTLLGWDILMKNDKN
ncbi:hypothetical protein DTO271D3_2475 [Paecilomyces variotii]|nr:hypothetical protein DTO032I3_2154 [Paecilomyces variotii]KAJ9280825.1 hypothetical protein DTO021D3_2295 [Paecilomyces variotii]KAJ9317185.1 hypothetical protein DTO271D3_2475 [Paecilomyces variotii]KAJ9345221.1 hypothetical protein DTO027B6_2366 [Paecilomyces variotii]KAJ9390365.1 hypothetical protein DTO032I4_1891 [Paecilomyces variotii]